MSVQSSVAVLLIVLAAVWYSEAGSGGCKTQEGTEDDDSVQYGGEAPDLPGFVAPLETLAAGSLIIPMDNAQQDDGGGVFNLEAYGAIFELLYQNIPVKWVIRTGKGKDEVDLTVNTTPVLPAAMAAMDRDYRAGPFVVDETHAVAASAILTSLGIHHHVTNNPVSVEVRHELTSKPFIGISNADKNADIHEGFLVAAAVDPVAYGFLDKASLALLSEDVCFSVVTEPHFDAGADAPIFAAGAREFLESGGNMLAECAAIETYENGGFFMTTMGIDPNGGAPNPPHYTHSDTPFAQWEGDIAQAGGSVSGANLLMANDFRPDTFVVVSSETNPNEDLQVWATRIDTVDERLGGVLHYLGGHSYGSGNQENINGIRAYMNAVLSPTTRPELCELDITQDLEVTVTEEFDGALLGQAFDYHVVVENLGAVDVDMVVVSVDLDPSVTFNSATFPGCMESMSVVTCDIGTLSAGETLEFDINVTPNVIGSIGVTTTVSSSGAEPFLGNNGDCEPTSVCSLSTQVTLSKVATSVPAIIATGEAITYVVTAMNTDTVGASGLVAQDRVVSGLEIVSVTPSAGTATIAEDMLSADWDIGSLGAGASETLTVTARITETAFNTNVVNEACLIKSDLAVDPTVSCDSDVQTTVAEGLNVVWRADHRELSEIAEVEVGENLVQVYEIGGGASDYTDVQVNLGDWGTLFTQNGVAHGYQDQMISSTLVESFATATVPNGAFFQITEINDDNNFSSGDISVGSSPSGGDAVVFDEEELGLAIEMIPFDPTTFGGLEGEATLTFQYLRDGPEESLIVSYLDSTNTQQPLSVFAGAEMSDSAFVDVTLTIPADFGFYDFSTMMYNNAITFETDGKSWWLANVTLISSSWEAVSSYTPAFGGTLQTDQRLRHYIDSTVNSAASPTTVMSSVATTTPASSTPVTREFVVVPLVNVRKSADKTRVNPGGTVVYTVVVENRDIDQVVTVTDVLPAALTPGALVVSGDPCAPVGLGAHPVILNQMVAQGCTITIEYSAVVSDAIFGDVTLVNTATITGGMSDSASVYVRPIVVLDKQAPAAIGQGDTMQYTISIRSRAESGSVDIDVTDVIPAEFTPTLPVMVSEDRFVSTTFTESFATDDVGPLVGYSSGSIVFAAGINGAMTSVSGGDAVVVSGSTMTWSIDWSIYSEIFIVDFEVNFQRVAAGAGFTVVADDGTYTSTHVTVPEGDDVSSLSATRSFIPQATTVMYTLTTSGDDVNIHEISYAVSAREIIPPSPAAAPPNVLTTYPLGFQSIVNVIIDVTHDGTETSPLANTATVDVLSNSIDDTVETAVLGTSTRSFTALQDNDLQIQVIGLDELFLLDRDSVVVPMTTAGGNNVLLNSFGNLIFDPLSTFSGMDSFDYTICAIDDPGVCATRTVEVDVEEQVVATDDSINTFLNSPATDDVLSDDAGPFDVGELSIFSPPSNGMANLVAGGMGESAMVVEYTPNMGYMGPDTFFYEVCRTGREVAVLFPDCPAPGPENCAVGRVTVFVDIPPEMVTAVDDSALMLHRAVSIDIDILDNDSVDNGGTLDPTSVSFTTPQPPEGTFTYLGGGVVRFVPNSVPWFPGSATITYEICSILPTCDTAVITVTAAGACDLPIGVLLYPPVDANIMMYYPVNLQWEIQNSYPGLEFRVELSGGNLVSPRILADNLPSTQLSFRWTPHHLFSSPAVGLYTLAVYAHPDLCLFDPEVDVDLHGTPQSYCFLPESLQHSEGTCADRETD